MTIVKKSKRYQKTHVIRANKVSIPLHAEIRGYPYVRKSSVRALLGGVPRTPILRGVRAFFLRTCVWLLIRVSRVRTPEGALRTLFLRTLRLPRGRCFFFIYAGFRGVRRTGTEHRFSCLFVLPAPCFLSIS